MSLPNSTRGTLVPPWYKATIPDTKELQLISITLGLTLGVGLWTAKKAFDQTWASWNRHHRLNAYMVLIWAEFVGCLIYNTIFWFFLTRHFGPSFEYFFGIIILWSIQVQCLPQIIINRIRILMDVPAHGKRLQWAIFSVLLLVNISVACVWIPARLQINKTYIHFNEIWDRIEKVVFLILDLGLNLTFIYLVKARLVARGLTKYHTLFKCNLGMIFFSISLDIITIGLMSLEYPFAYVQFQTLSNVIKLNIELTMADLIVRVARSPHEG